MLTEASAPGKIILCGEHAVVYGRPAIALPLANVRARAVVSSGTTSGIIFDAPDLERRWTLADTPDHPLSELVLHFLAHFAIATPPDLLIELWSSIPIASGMGSGAAIATAIVRALARHLGHDLPNDRISALVYASEQRFHGTPSGIDNSVIAYEHPIWFARRSPLSVVSSDLQEAATKKPEAADYEPLVIATPLTLLIGDTGIRSPTRLPVGQVRQHWQSQPARYEALFDAVGALAFKARAALATGDSAALGALLDANHAILVQIGVSSAELDQLVGAARGAGALGAKLSGAGWGGVMIALATPDTRQEVAQALRATGASRVLETSIAPYRPASPASAEAGSSARIQDNE
jgi:mevalonate kinase